MNEISRERDCLFLIQSTFSLHCRSMPLSVYILVLPPFIHSPTFNPPSIRLPPAFLSHRYMHTEYPTIKEKAVTRNYEQDVSLLTDLLVQLGDVQLKKTLGNWGRHDGRGTTVPESHGPEKEWVAGGEETM